MLDLVGLRVGISAKGSYALDCFCSSASGWRMYWKGTGRQAWSPVKRTSLWSRWETAVIWTRVLAVEIRR